VTVLIDGALAGRICFISFCRSVYDFTTRGPGLLAGPGEDKPQLFITHTLSFYGLLDEGEKKDEYDGHTSTKRQYTQLWLVILLFLDRYLNVNALVFMFTVIKRD